ncbi:MAG: PAS domain-containing protein [Candidatus Thorarchaeota archaeon]
MTDMGETVETIATIFSGGISNVFITETCPMSGESMDGKGLDLGTVKLVFDNSPEGVLLFRDTTLVYANRAASARVGWNLEQIVGEEVSRLSRLLDSAEEKSALESFYSLLNESISQDSGEYSFVKPTGESVVMHVNSYRFALAGSKYLVGHLSDVTAERSAREKLRRERSAYNAIAQAALATSDLEEACQKVLEGIVESFDLDLGAFRLYDPEKQTLRLAGVVGLKPGDTPEVVPIDDPNFIVARTARTREPLFIREISEAPESKDRLARARELGIHALIFWPVIGSKGDLLGVINVASTRETRIEDVDREFFATLSGMLTTIIERKRTEKELAESQDRFLAFANNMPGPLYIKDHESRVLFVNDYMKSRRAQKAWEGKTPDQLFRENHAQRVQDEDREVIEKGPIEREQVFLDEERGHRTYHMYKFPIFREGKPPLIGGFSLDVTKRVQAERELERAKARAEFFNDLLAHDLNNMHQGIMSSLELIITSDDCTPTLMRIAEGALMQVKRSVSLISNVMKLTQLSRESIPLTPHDPAESLGDAIEIVKQSFPTRSISVETNLESEMYCIMANHFLTDVFYNLMHNSVKNTRDDEVRITVHTSLVQDGETLRIEISDWGKGIPDDTKERLLAGINEPTSRIGGVGLILVRQIVDLLGGEVWIEDRFEGDYTKGARFVIHLPNGC